VRAADPISMRAMERARRDHPGRAAAVSTADGPRPAVTCACGWRTVDGDDRFTPGASVWDRHRRHVAAAARRIDMITPS